MDLPSGVVTFPMTDIEGRAPRPDAATAAGRTAAGICAHESPMAGGEAVAVPSFR